MPAWSIAAVASVTGLAMDALKILLKLSVVLQAVLHFCITEKV